MKLRRIFAAFLAVILLFDASPFGVIHAAEAAQTDTVISAPDTDHILRSASVKYVEGNSFLERGNYDFVSADAPRIDTLLDAAPGQFNASGTEWIWMAYKVNIPVDGTYTLGVTTVGASRDSFKIPMVVGGEVYTLAFTAKSQTVTAEVTLPAGEHVVTVFWPMPANESEVSASGAWYNYPWANIASVTVDALLTVSKPTAAEVEAAVIPNKVFAATDANTVLWSAAMGDNGYGYLEFNSRDAVKADKPYIDSLRADAPGEFNKSGEEWGWIAYKVTAPADGTYTLALQNQACRVAPYCMPLYVNEKVYTLSYSATGRQSVAVNVTLSAGEHTVVIFMPMPQNAAGSIGEDWKDYPWCNLEIITVDALLTVSKPTASEVEASIVPAVKEDAVISAVDTDKLLLSATIQKNAATLARTDQATMKIDQPTIETLYNDAFGQFNKAGEEWNWFAYKVTAPTEGTYKLGVKTAGSKYDSYKIPLCVNGEVYALQYTAKSQEVTAEVSLPAGEHVVVVFMPMPATKDDIAGNEWNDYHWCDVESVTVDGELTVSKPTVAEVEAVFAPVTISAVDTDNILLSATIQKNAATLARTDQATMKIDQPTIETLYNDAFGQFNKAGEEWNWFAYKVTAPTEGTYTLGVKTAGSKVASYQIPLCVNGEVYALQYTAKSQEVTAEVSLPAGEHVVVVFMPMPATKDDIAGNEWNDYHWCDVESVTVDAVLAVSKPTYAEVEACFPPVEKEDTVISAVDTDKLLLSATIQKNANALGRTDQTTLKLDQPTIRNLYYDAFNQFNAPGEEWNWFAYKVNVPAEGTYTLGVKTAGSKVASYQIPLCVNGELYALQYTAKSQLVTAEVTLPAGEHVVVMFMPMPDTKDDITGNEWNDYHWCDVESVTVDGLLTVSKPTYAEVEACFPDPVKDGPLKEQSVLFVGDSITHSANSWASKIGTWYNMDWTNAGVSGATISELRGKIIRHQLMINAENDYDYVIMHGGINDADAQVGTVSDSWNVADFDTSTYAGALETMFYYAYENFEGAKLGYIVNYATPNADATKWTGTQDMSAYFAEGKKVCEKWGISYIDLYFGKTPDGKSYSYDILQVDTNAANFLGSDPHEIHLSDAGYHVICPYIAQWMETLTAKASPIPAVSSGKHIDAIDGEKVLYGGFTAKSEYKDGTAIAGLQDRVYTGMVEDNATIERLPYAKDMLGDWAFASVAVDAAQDGEYTIRVEMSAKASYQMGMLVDGKAYTLVYTKQNGYYQFLEQTVSLTKGTHYITFTAAMPKDDDGLAGDDWNVYPWTNIASVIVDEGLQVLSKPALEDVTAKLEIPDPAMISAVDTDRILHSATIKVEDTYLSRTDQATLKLDQPIIEALYADAYGQFNESGSEWNWFAYKIQVPAEGTYTLGVKTAGSKNDSYKLPLYVNGNVYALQYTAKAQLVTAEVALPAGEHVVVMFMPMPATNADITGNEWNDYHWCDVKSVAVDAQLTISKPTVTEVEACFAIPAYTRVEAEDTEYVLYNNYNTPNEENATASGGMVVGGAWTSTYQQTFEELEDWLNSKGNAYVEYAVVAPADGEYDIRVAFLAGSNGKTIAKPYIAVVVNNKTYKAQFTRNWNQVERVKLTVSLKEGLNIIRCTSMTTEQEIYGARGWINHDFLDLDTRLTPVGRSSPVKIEAESVKHFNKLSVQEGGETEAASGKVLGGTDRRYMSALKLTLDQLTGTNLRQIPYISFTVSAPQNGYYPIRVAMTADGRLKQSTVGMIVDGQLHVVDYVRTDKTSKGAMVETLVYLTAGEHVITFTTPIPAAADPETNYSYYWANYDYVMLYDGLVLAATQKAPTAEAEYVRIEVEDYAMFNLNKNNGAAAGNAYYKSAQSMAEILENGIDGGKTPYIELTVQAGKAGSYVLYVGASAGMTEGNTLDEVDTQLALEVNGTLSTQWVRAAKSTNYTILPLTVELEKGVNTIRLTHLTSDAHYGGTTWIDFDYIEMPAWEAQQIVFTESGETLEAETARYDGFGESLGGSYSGGRYLGRANYDTVAEVNITYDTLDPKNLSGLPYVTYRVFAEKAGTYAVTVGFGAGLTNYTSEEIQQGVKASFVAIVNGESKQRVEFKLGSTSANMTRLVMLELKEGENEVTITGTTSEYVIDRVPRNDETYRLVWIDQDYLLLSGGLSNLGQDVDPFDIEDSGYDFSQLVPRTPSETPQPGENPPVEQPENPVILWFLTGVGAVTVLFIIILIGKKRKKDKE